jgi:uncharacterized protein (DUF1800 family)
MRQRNDRRAQCARRWQRLPLAAALAYAGMAGAIEPTATVVEYYNARLDHYFMTAAPEEAAMLDAGVLVPGWMRTGIEFKAWANPGDGAGAVPVCRFFGTPGRGPNSHFYTADAAECAKVKTNPDWTFEAIAYYIALPQGAQCAPTAQPVWRSFHPGASVAESNHRFVPDLTVHQKMAGGSILEGVVMCSPLSSEQADADAVRLLEQATFGPTPALIAQVRQQGATAFIDAQLALPATRYPGFAPVAANKPDTCVDDRSQPLRPDSYCARDNYSLFQLQREFFRNAIQAPDQLRQRVAFALSQILVTSGTEINKAYAMQRYQQLLVDQAFGNFETLLLQVTLSPAMGRYLDMANNVKPNPATGVQPNENYAREILQLFSVGTLELAADGTPLTDATGRPIATYDQDEIEGYAHVFTGWTYPTAPGQPVRPLNGQYYDGAMEERSAAHDYNAKALLDGAQAPANLAMGADLANAIHSIFMHPNVGPFLGRQLIQKLVTGDPSPAYVARVAAVFANNGAGVRGDLKAVVRAVLLDAEARGPVKFDPGYGRLREPAQLVAASARALGAQTDGVYFRGQTVAMGQPLFYAPSVFNYYPPDYVVPGTSALGPEFGIQNTASTLARINFLNSLAFAPAIAPDPTVYGATGTALDWSALVAAAADTPTLLAALDRLLLHNTMSAGMRSTLAAAVDAIPVNDPSSRARTAFYLVAGSSQFQVER